MKKKIKGLHLITGSTPNGKKVQILLEELKQVYAIEWTTSLIDLDTEEQKEDWFLHLNPNGQSRDHCSSWLQVSPWMFGSRTGLINPVVVSRRLGKIPVLVDNRQSLPFPVM